MAQMTEKEFANALLGGRHHRGSAYGHFFVGGTCVRCGIAKVVWQSKWVPRPNLSRKKEV